MKFSCCIVGVEVLLAECGELLLARGHEVRGVVSCDVRLARWAERRRLHWLEAKGDHIDDYGGELFDYLFSIINLCILPAAVLRLPRRLAINFHDAPLPVAQAQGRLRDLLVAEIGATLVLLVCTGLLVVSVRTMLRERPGFRTHGIPTMRLGLPAAAYPGAQEVELFRRPRCRS